MDQVCIAWVVEREDWTHQELYGVYTSREAAIEALKEAEFQWQHLPMFHTEQFVYTKTPRSPQFIWLEDYELDA